MQYQALDDWSHFAEAMRRYFAAAEDTASPEVLAHMAQELSDAETWQGHAAESKAAARLAMHYHEDMHVYWKIMRAMAAQRKLTEARQFCESLVGRRDVPYDDLVCAWGSFLGWFTEMVGGDHPEDADVRQVLDGVSRALDLLKDGDESGMGVTLVDLLLVCSTGQAAENLVLDGRGAYLNECLALARRMATGFSHGVDIPARGWFVTGIIEYKLGHYEAAIAALQHCLRDYPLENFDPGGPGIRVGSSSGLIHYVLGRAYQQQGRPREAIEAYQQVLVMLDSGRAQAQDALRSLRALGGEPLPPAPWLRRVGGAGRSVEAEQRQRLAHWLRARGYDLRDARLAAGGERSLSLSAHGIQVLVWEGRPSDYPSPADLRAYVAGGGNLLICLSTQPSIAIIGPTLATGSQTLDLSLNWLLPAFGMRMSDRAIPATSDSLETLALKPAIALGESPSYHGAWFPLQTTPPARVIGIGRGAGDPGAGVVVAAARLGLGKVAVVSLLNWFPGADDDLDEVREPWQDALLAGILDWFAEDELPQRYPAAAKHWAAARNLVALGDYGTAVQELDKVEEGVPSAADARYWAACLLADRIGDADGAVRRWREVASSADADSWLVRMAHLRPGIAAVRVGDERTATLELTQAAGEQPDGIWGQAWVAVGDLKLANGDWLGAAQAFRKVADELGHSEERFRALFGLAYALGKQGKPEAAARVCDAIRVEFGKAPVPADVDSRWADPWQTYYPGDLRKQDPTVADVVAAIRPKL
jgi:tetratricopeptide (TPR) repeat protein